FDMSEPVDFAEIEMPPRPSAEPAAKPNVVPNDQLTAILHELQRMKRDKIVLAIEDAQAKEYRDGQLIVTFGGGDRLSNTYATWLRESANLFREIGENLFRLPIRVEVKISGQVEKRLDENELKKQERRERALQNPAVKIVLEKMRGELQDVR